MPGPEPKIRRAPWRGFVVVDIVVVCSLQYKVFREGFQGVFRRECSSSQRCSSGSNIEAVVLA
jgi:hypothetical protein